VHEGDVQPVDAEPVERLLDRAPDAVGAEVEPPEPVLPGGTGSSPRTRRPTLELRTKSERGWAASARPISRSETPPPYIGAVSK